MTTNYQDTMDKDRYFEIVNRVGPHVIDIFQQFKNELGGRLPAELSYGMVAGYLRGKGFTWEESFIGMNRHICITESLGAVGEASDKTVTIKGRNDGTVEVDMKENQNAQP